jgi:hypothetical protein
MSCYIIKNSDALIVIGHRDDLNRLAGGKTMTG